MNALLFFAVQLLAVRSSIWIIKMCDFLDLLDAVRAWNNFGLVLPYLFSPHRHRLVSRLL